ncbi:MATE family efflux transporter [Cohnella lubricantis]|uniref:MATE family efflux transporter n=1 Tax=Cohnella lubricantis TaxID=2163172 RepID=A0A841TA47_9BACL|nr:MATE family efflux transporter [Cohnella lubricantis]MBB6678174.1 MATE family efflux transporter [Cohnella lubricantis]MBP2119700.1 putative MATE family efflux protein [Cohnella lubricantis]
MDKNRELRLFKLTWPILLENLLFMLMSTADTLMLSGVSDKAVSAVGVAGQFVFIAIILIGVINNGADVVISQYLGSGRRFEASKIAALTVTMNLLAGLTISLLFIAFTKPLMGLMNLEPDTMDMAVTYLRIVGGWIFFQAIINALSGIIRTYGYAKEAMLVSLGMNVVHIALNYALIFGKAGMPALGVEGAALSTVMSRGAAIVVFLWMMYKVVDVRIRMKDYLTISKEYLGKILTIGVPTALESVLYHCCQSVFLYYASFLGDMALASRQYAMNISSYVYLFSLACGTATAILVGRLVGGERPEEAYKRVWKSAFWSVSITVVIDLIAISVRHPLMGLFTEDPDILKLAAQMVVLSLVLESGRSLNMLFVPALRAAGDAKYTVYWGIVSMVCMSLPLGYVLVFVFDMGLAGIWLAIAADEWARGIIMFFRWRSRRWEGKALVSAERKPAAALET